MSSTYFDRTRTIISAYVDIFDDAVAEAMREERERGNRITFVRFDAEEIGGYLTHIAHILIADAKPKKETE